MSGSPDSGAAVPCLLRAELEDFRVEELPLYPAAGEGEHLFVTVEKRGIDTGRAKRLLSERLGVPVRDIGHAGMKDARAVTRQRLSLPGVAPERALAIETESLRVLEAVPHGHKLRLGHLAGNRFRLVLREVPEASGPALQRRWDELVRVGAPNRFMEQRFGRGGDNGLLGRLLALGDEEAFRTAARARGHRRPAKGLRRLLLSAWQAEIFNRVLERRLAWPGGLSALEVGDLAQRADSGGLFLVEDPREAERAQRGEVSATGPLPGPRCRAASGRPGELEAEVLAEEGVGLEAPGLRGLGARRALRVLLGEARLEQGEGRVTLEFVLPPGAYATAVVHSLTGGGAREPERRPRSGGPEEGAPEAQGAPREGR
jgi:tRNA pseudouridine13 synthase